jgi:hypothetical protein
MGSYYRLRASVGSTFALAERDMSYGGGTEQDRQFKSNDRILFDVLMTSAL